MRLGGLGILVLSRAAQASVGLVVLKILTTQLTKDDVAGFYFIVASSVWFAMVIVNPINMWTNRHIIEWKPKFSWSSIYLRLLSLYLVVTALGVAIMISLNGWLKLNENVGRVTLALGIIAILFGQTFYQYLSGLQNIVGSKFKYSVFMISAQAFVLLAACGIFFIPKPSLLHWFAFMMVGSLAAIGLFTWSMSREIQGAQNAKMSDLIQWNSILWFCLPVVGITFAVWVQSQGYRIVLSVIGRVEILALMGVSLGIAANVGATIESLIQQYLVPDFYRVAVDDPAGSYRAWQAMFEKVIIFVGFTCAGIFCFSHIILRLLTGPEYLEGYHFVRWGATIEFFRILANFVYLRFVGEKRIIRALPAFLAGAIVTGGCYGAAMLLRLDTELTLLTGLIVGSLLCLVLLFFQLRAHLRFRRFAKSLLWALVLATPYGLAFLVPAHMSIPFLLGVVGVAGAYTIAVLFGLVRRELL